MPTISTSSPTLIVHAQCDPSQPCHDQKSKKRPRSASGTAGPSDAQAAGYTCPKPQKALKSPRPPTDPSHRSEPGSQLLGSPAHPPQETGTSTEAHEPPSQPAQPTPDRQPHRICSEKQRCRAHLPDAPTRCAPAFAASDRQPQKQPGSHRPSAPHP